MFYWRWRAAAAARYFNLYYSTSIGITRQILPVRGQWSWLQIKLLLYALNCIVYCLNIILNLNWTCLAWCINDEQNNVKNHSCFCKPTISYFILKISLVLAMRHNHMVLFIRLRGCAPCTRIQDRFLVHGWVGVTYTVNCVHPTQTP